MTTWFTSDLHLGHANIIKFCNRPFSDVDHMDSVLIERWNFVVQPDDEIYVLGDFSMSNHKRYLDRLSGTKHLIKGNHDKRPSISDGWSSISDIKEITIENQPIVLCHFAMRTWNRSHYGAFSLYGHSHGTLPDDPCSLSFDVGVDCHAYRPISFQDVKRIMKQKTPTGIIKRGER